MIWIVQNVDRDSIDVYFRLMYFGPIDQLNACSM